MPLDDELRQALERLDAALEKDRHEPREDIGERLRRIEMTMRDLMREVQELRDSERKRMMPEHEGPNMKITITPAMVRAWNNHEIRLDDLAVALAHAETLEEMGRVRDALNLYLEIDHDAGFRWMQRLIGGFVERDGRRQEEE